MTIIPFPELKKSAACCCGRAGRIDRLRLPVADGNLGRIRFAGCREDEKPLSPIEALASLEKSLLDGVVPDTVELAGPGDPLADPGRTLETAALIHRKHPELSLAIETLGIGGEKIAESLAGNGVRHVTVRMDAVAPEVVQKLYAWIRPGKKTVPLSRAVAILLDEQAKGLQSFRNAGMKVTIKTTVYPGYNDDHIGEIADRAAELGAEDMIIVPCKPGTAEADAPPEPDRVMMEQIHVRAAGRIKIVEEKSGAKTKISSEYPRRPGAECLTGLSRPSRERPRVAVVSSNGMEVDLHLGHAIRVLVYGPREDGLVCLLETREAPEPGSGRARWDALADRLGDCFALLAAGAGESPRKVLGGRGIKVIIAEGDIDGMVDVLYGGGKKKKK